MKRNDSFDDDFDIPWVGLTLACIAIALGLYLLSGGIWFSYDQWAPKYEQTRRETWEQSESHIAGKRQYLSRLYKEWTESDPTHRSTICAVAREEASTVDIKLLSETLQNWECVK